MNEEKVKVNLPECIMKVRKTQMLMVIGIFFILPALFILDTILEMFFK